MIEANYRKKILSNVSWALLGKIINLASALFVGVLVARYLGPTSYGIMNYVIAFVMLFTVFSNFGLENIEIRELSKNENNINQIMGTAFVLRIASSTIAIILVVALAVIFEKDRMIVLMLIIYSSTLLLGSFNIIRNYFTSIVFNEYVVKTEIVRVLLGVLLKLFLLWAKAPLYMFVIILAFDFVLVASGYIFSYQKFNGSLLKWSYSTKYAQYLIREALPYLLSGMVIAVYLRVDQILIKNLLNPEMLGLFSAANKIIEIGSFLPIVVCQTIAPILIRKRKNDPEAYLKARKKFLDISFWGGMTLSVGIFLMAPILIETLFGEEYSHGIPVLRVLSWKILFVTMFHTSAQLITIEEIQKWAVFRNLLGLLTCLCLNLALIPRYGISGSAYSAILTIFMSGMLAHIFINPYKHIAILQITSVFYGLTTTLKEIKNMIMTRLVARN